MSIECSLNYAAIFVDYLHALSRAWILYCANQSVGHDRTVFNENLISNMWDFVRKLSTLQTTIPAGQIERFFAAKSQLIRAICSFVGVFCGKTELYNSLESASTNNNSDAPLIQRTILESLSATLSESSDQMDFVLRNYFDEVLSIDSALIVNAASNQANLPIILNQLVGLAADNYSNKMALWTFLDVIENASIEKLPVAMEYLAVQVFDVNGFYYKQASAIRRAYYILGSKLQKFAPLNDEATNPQMDVYESVVNESFIADLRQFRRYKWHEL